MSYEGIIANSIGLCIKGRRSLKGWTQQKLAQKVNISTQQLSAIERGFSIPSLPTLIYLAIAFDTTPSQLLREAETNILPFLKSKEEK